MFVAMPFVNFKRKVFIQSQFISNQKFPIEHEHHWLMIKSRGYSKFYALESMASLCMTWSFSLCTLIHIYQLGRQNLLHSSSTHLLSIKNEWVNDLHSEIRLVGNSFEYVPTCFVKKLAIDQSIYEKKTESVSFVKNAFREMNKRLTREACIKIIEQAERTEAEFADCFTAAVTGDSMHDIYKVRYPHWPLTKNFTMDSMKYPSKTMCKRHTGSLHNWYNIITSKPLSQSFCGLFWYLPSTKNDPFWLIWRWSWIYNPNRIASL